MKYAALTAALAVAGAFVVTSTFAFGHGTANAIDFAVAIGVTVVAAAGAALAREQVALSVASAALGIWTILVTAGIFSGATQRWITFAAGAGIAGLAIAGHAIHDARRERAGLARPVSAVRAA